jgi:hypothetical protein
MALELVYKKSLGRSYRIVSNALEQLVSYDWSAIDQSDKMTFSGIESTEPRKLEHGFQTSIIDGNHLEVYLADGTIHQFELKLVNTLIDDSICLQEKKLLEQEVIQDPYSRDGREG